MCRLSFYRDLTTVTLSTAQYTCPTTTIVDCRCLCDCYSGAYPCQRHYEVATLAADRFKLCVLMHNVSNRTSPSYLLDTTTLISSIPGHHRLHSARPNEFNVSRTRSKFGNRAFFVAGSRGWNNLLANISNTTDLSTFERAITTHF